MRQLHQWLDRPNNAIVSGPNTANPVSLLVAVQNEELQIIAHNLERNPAQPANPAFLERPLSFSAMRASIGLIDAAPKTGTFKLKVGAQTTGALTWPDDLSSADLIATWKASVLAALKLLSNVDDDDIVSADPPNTPAHIFYFTWTDPARVDVIEIVQNRLSPPIDATSQGSLTNLGYTQQVKLEQFPIAATTVFTSPLLPGATIDETAPGSAGVNEEQTLIVPPDANGSLSLTWNGVATKTMGVDKLTAAQIAAALNAIVPAGASDPSFAVEPRATTDGKRFAITFIGPLAGAAQPDLLVTMHDQIARPYAVGLIDLRGNLAIEQALNGAADVLLTFELVIDDNEYYLLPLKIINSMTNPTTLSDLEAGGGVVRVEVPVYIDATGAEPFAEIAPGYTFTPVAAGSLLVITHGLATWRPGYRVTLYEVDHEAFAAALADGPTDPDVIAAALATATTGSSTIRDVLLTEHANSENQFSIQLPWALVNDPSNALDFRLLKIDVWSPDATIKLWLAQILWDNCVESEGGQTLTEKLAAIDVAISIIDGTIQIDAGKIIGLIQTSQINLTTLATAIVNNANFATALTTLITNNGALITAIANALSTNSTFATVLANLFKTDTTLLTSLVQSLSTSTEYLSSIRSLVYNIIQGGANLPDGASLFIIDDVRLAIPAPQEIAGPGIVKLVPATITTSITTGGTTSEVQKVDTTAETESTRIPIYAALAPAIPVYTDGGNKSGILTPGTANAIYTVIAPGAQSRGIRGRRGQRFAAGAKIACDDGFWYEVVLIDGVYYARECERTLSTIVIDEIELFESSRFLAEFPLFLKLAGNVMGRCEIVLEIGDYNATDPGANLSTVAWNTLFATPVHLSPVNKYRKFAVLIERFANDHNPDTDEDEPFLKLTFKLQGQPFSMPAPGPNFALRLRLSKFDTEDAADPRGSLQLTMTAAPCSIVALTT